MCMPAYMCVHNMHAVTTPGKKRASNPLELGYKVL